MQFRDRIDPALLEGALAIAATLRAAGHEALFAGGAVRDLLLGRPISDIDLATSARPDQIESLFEHTVAVGRQFGVIVVVCGEHSYEVATFRRDSEYSDGRHPSSVDFCDALQDCRRRDFTVNALFYDPASDTIIDYVEGRADLEARLIRTVGSPADRFREDKLRLFRAVRLACQLDFSIERESYRQLVELSAEIRAVSQERIRDELFKILVGPDPARGLRLLRETGLLQAFLPEAAAMAGVEQPPQFHPEGDVFVHTCLMFELSESPNEALALGILLHDVGKPPTFTVADRIRFDGHAEVGAEMSDAICRRLRVSNELRERVVDLVRQHLRFMHVQQMRQSTLKRFLRQDHFEDHLELHRLDCLASHGDLSNYEFCRARLLEFQRELIRPRPLLNGDDLVALGFKPGPIFSEILTALEDQQLEGRIAARPEAIEWVNATWRGFSKI